jgi:hypothetical protein
MKTSRLGALCLASLWFAACATAQDGGVSADSDGGASGSGSGGALGVSGTGSSFGGGVGIGATGGNGFAGSGGSLGSAGSGGASSGAASSGAAGGAGVSGAVGSGGSAGSSGAGGSGGTGGSAAAPVFDTGVCVENPTLSVLYIDSATDQTSISAQYELTNTSATPLPLANLKLRYFFTNEETSGWVTNIYNSRRGGGTLGDKDLGSQTSITVSSLGTALDGADSYVEIAFSGSDSLETGADVTVNWALQPKDYNPPNQVQSNDYSANPADTTFTAWDHIAVYQGTTLIAGCVPRSPSDGSAGAGGDTGMAGESGVAGAPG